MSCRDSGGHSVRKAGFDDSPIHVGFVVNRGAWNRFFSESLALPCSSVIPVVPHSPAAIHKGRYMPL